jgi:hypothetical protein
MSPHEQTKRGQIVARSLAAPDPVASAEQRLSASVPLKQISAAVIQARRRPLSEALL